MEIRDERTLLLATANAGKVRELQHMLVGVAVRSLKDVGIADLDEPGDDFIENAVAKAMEASRRTGLPALADDSGLSVDALGGAPGVFSARFAGGHGNDAANRALLLARLAAVRETERGARFRCVIALADAQGPLGDRCVWTHGICEGTIGFSERGTGGFGYDALFTPRGFSQTFAELSHDAKQGLSHRGRALRAMLPTLRAYLSARRTA